MARPLISSRTVQTIQTLRDRGWATARATQDPQIDVIIYRDGVDPLDPQEVVVDWPTDRVAHWAGENAAAGETVLPLTMSRTLTDGFDVQVGDRAAWTGFTGEVTRVWEVNGRKWAAVVTDTGTS